MKIRPAVIDDIPGITSIYNEAILTTDATFDVEPKTVEDRIGWFGQHNHLNPIVVAEENTAIVGWASLSKWSDRCSYESTVEISVYVAAGYRNQGIGRKLMQDVLQRGEEAGLHTVLSRITTGNQESIHLHESLGFETIGIMKEVGFKNGHLLDVQVLQKMFANSPLAGKKHG